MKKNTFKKFIASLGVAVLVTSNIGSALTPLTIYAAEDNSEGESSADVSEAEPAAEENSEPEEAEPASVEESEPEESNEGAYSDDAESGNEGDRESSEENADEAGSEDPSVEEAAEDTVPEESDEIDTSDESASLDASLDEEAELNDSVNTEEGQKKEKRSLTVKVKAVKKSGGSIIDGNEEEIDFDDDDIIDLTKDTDDFSTEIEIGGCKYTYVDAAYKDDVITAIKTNIKSETDSEIITETKFTSDKEFKNFTEDSSWTECFDESDIKDHKAVITLNYSKVEVPVIKEEPAEKVTEETTEAATVESTEEAEETKKTEEAGKDNSESKEESSEASSTEKTEGKKEDTSNIEETVSHKFYGEAIADGTALSDKAFELTVEGAADVAELAPEYDGYSFVEAQYDGTVITAIDKDAVEANGTWTEISKDVTDVTVSFYYEAVEDTTEETDKETADDKKTEADEKTYEITATFKENKKDKVFTFTPVDGSDTVVLDLTEEQVSIEDISDQYYTGTLKLTDAWIGLCKITSVSKYGYVKLNGDGEVVPFTSDTNIIFHYDEEESTLISGLDKVFGNLLLPKTAEGSLSFNEFDLDNNTVYWSILVDKTEDAKWPISDVVITEAEMKYGYGVDAELVNDMSVVWDDLKVSSEGKTISDESYSVDQENNTVTFEVLDRPVEIIVAAKLSESDTIEADEKFTAVNKVELTADGKDSDEYTATAEYEAEVDESEDESDGVVLDATLVDVFGEPISEEYTNIELPEFNEDGILVLDDADNAPVKDVVVGDEEQGIKKYVYVEASLNDEVITAIKKEVVEADEAAETEESVDEETADTEEAAPAEKIAFFYTTDGENWISIEEDSTVELTYSCEKQSLYVYEDDNVKITVAVPEETVLPNDTQLEVLPILKGTPEYKEVTAAFDNADAAKTEADAEAVEEENKKVEYLYDISFVKEDEEIEPEGEVAVSFEFKHAKIDGEGKPEECEVTVDHLLDDGTVENLDADSKINNKGELKQVDVVTESFSVFRVLAARTAQSTTDTIPEAAYSLEYLLNHYQAVALEGDLELNIHCMGPVLVKGGLSGGGSGFGDSAYTDVSSYIGGYVSYHGPSNSRQETAPHNLYVGTSNTVTDNNTDLNGMADFNKGIRGSDVPGEIYTTDNYVDWARMSGVVSGTVNSIQGLAKNSYEGQWDWQEISVPAGSVVDLKTNGKKIKINITGSSDKTTVINVTDGGNNVLVPMIANVQATEDNRNAPPIAFTFPNATGVKVVADLTPQSGHVIAPNAKITVEGGNYNGCLVGKSIVSNGEGHLWPYKGGSLVPTTAGLNVTKTVDGKTPDTNNFKFTVSELKNGAWQVIDTKKNNGSDVKFSSITYNEAGEHWYLIQEDQTPVQGYILSADKYLLKVSVSAGQSGSLDVTLSSNVTIYKAKDGVSADALISRGTVDQSKISQLNVSSGQTSADVIKFNNTKPGSLKLVKNFKGATLTDDQKNSVSFTVTGPDGYSKTVSYSEFTSGSYTLTGLKPGSYTVTENGANLTGYDWSMETSIDVTENGAAKVVAGSVTTATFTNEYSQHVGSLELSKAFSGIDAGTLTDEQKAEIQFTVTGPNNYSNTVSYSDFTDGKYTISDLPIGEYTVAESGLPSIDNMQATVKINGTETASAKVTVTNGGKATAAISNDYTSTVGSLKLVKNFTGAALTDEQKNSVSFTVTGPNNYSQTVSYSEFTNGSYTLTGLKPGSYTVTENGANLTGYDWSMETSIDVTENGAAKVVAGSVTTATFTNEYSQHVGSLELSKAFSGIDAGTLTDEQKAEIQFTVTGPNNYSNTVSYSDFTDGKYTISDLPIGEYTVAESGLPSIDNMQATVKINGTETASAKVTVTNGGKATAAISNDYTSTVGSLKLVKNFTGAALTDEQKNSVSFTVTGPNNYSQTVGYSEFTNGSYTLTGLTPGSYTVTESGADLTGYSWTMNASIDNGENGAANVVVGGVTTETFTNNYTQLVGSIELSKAFSGIDAGTLTDEQKAEIQFTVTGPNNYSNTVSYSDFTDGKYTISDLPIGEYTVAESGLPSIDNMQATVKINGTETASAKVTVTNGGKATAAISNDYTSTVGSLKLVKNFTGAALTDEQKNSVSFTVTGPNNYSQTVGYSEFTNGSYTLTGLKPGSYTVTENGANLTGYDWSMETSIDVTENGAAKVVAGSVTTATFTNEYSQHVGSLELSKAFSGIDAGTLTDEQKAEIQFTVTGPNNYSNTVSYSDFTDGKYTISDLPIGEYTVAESGLPSIDNMQATVKINGTETASAKVTVTNGGKATAAISNDYTSTVGSLKLVKNFTGAALTDEQKNSVSFTVTGPNNYSQTVGYSEFTNGSYTLTGLTPGSYTVTESGADLTGYSWTMNASIDNGENGAANVVVGGVTTETFTNNYTQLVGSIELSKAFSGIDAGTLTDEQKAEIQFTVTGPNNYSNTVSYSDFTDGKYTIKDLPIGEYTVAETGLPSVENMQATVKINGTEAASATVTVTNGGKATAAISNDYTSTVGSLKLVKNFTGATLTDDQKNSVSFTIEGPDSYTTTVSYSEFTNGSYTLTGLKPGSYTVTESGEISGYTWRMNASIDNGTDGSATVVAGGITTETITNNYTQQTGSIELTKTIKGDVTKEEAEGAITFEVKKDGEETGKTYTLKDFTQDEDGKYTLKIEDVAIGSYTITETTHDITGKAVTVTYKVNSGESQTGDSAEAEVEKDKTTTVDFENDYSNDKGSIELTKTIKGDVTKEEAEGAITFEVKKDGEETGKTYTLKDFTQNEDGKYTLKIENVAIGSYTVTETTHDITGKAVTVTYKVNSGESQTGDSAEAEVEKDKTTTVDFENDYSNDKGSIELTKTIKGDVTKEEAEGAITFEVKKDGEETGKTYTLKDFTQNEDGKYTLKIENVAIGSYTITETTHDITGKAVTVTYKVNSGESQTGDSAATEVKKDETTTVDFENDYTDLTVTISKVDAGGKEIEGAEIEVTDKDGNTVEQWTSEKGKSHDITVKPGEYTFKEVNAPAGYEAVTEIKFTVDKDGNVTVTSTETNAAKVDEKTGKLVITDELTDRKVKFSKTDIAGDELAGATIVVTGTDAAGQKIEKTWVSDGKAHELELPMGTYTMTETAAPEGYVIATAIDFTVNANGTITVGEITTESEDKNIVTMVDGYADQTVTISKVDAGGKEIGGAEIEVTDKDGNTVEQWTSEKGKSHDITVKPGEYTFKEVNAPAGYEAVTEIKFTVDKDGNVTVTSTETNAAKVDEKTGKLVITDELTDRKVKFSKTDIAGDELAGATIVVTGTDAAGQKIEKTWVSDGKAHELELPMGTYTMTETAAPEGYVIATAIDFTVNANGTITVGEITTESEDKNIVTMVDGYADQTVTISKVDAGGKEIGGAEIEVTDKDGNTVDKWTSEKGKSHDITVKPGEYTFKEVNAPAGYEAVTEIKFTVDKDGNVTVTSTETNAAKVDEKTGKLVITDELTDRKVKFSKTDIAGDELAGATIVVTGTDAAGQKIEKTWVSDGKAHELELPMGTYTMTETAAPEGYVIATAIDFTVNANGTITVGEITTESEDKNIVTMVDGYADQTVTIRKTDIAGKELKGAELKVIDALDNVVEQWTSDGTAKKVTVKPGTYTLVETSAPKGYKVSESITFTVALDKKGNAVVTVDGKEVGEVVMVDAYSDKPTTPPGGGDGGGEGGGEGGGHGEQTPPTTPPSPPREVTPETPSVPRNIRLGVPSVPKNMKTGDDGQMPVYGGLSIASLGALLIWIRKRRKKSA